MNRRSLFKGAGAVAAATVFPSPSTASMLSTSGIEVSVTKMSDGYRVLMLDIATSLNDLIPQVYSPRTTPR